MKNKRKSIAVFAALLISVFYGLPEDGLPGMAVQAGQLESSSGSTDEDAPDVSPSEAGEEEKADVNRLQIPQSLHIVVDPWEIDGKGQIYSEQYVIRNTGENTGLLILSDMACRPSKKNGVAVKSDKKSIHEGKEKAVYMEVVLGDSERITLSQEGSEYRTEMEPGDELSLCFEGELNENASGSWKDGDMAVSILYSWEEIEKAPEEKRPVKEKRNNVKDSGQETEKEKDVSPVSPDTDGQRNDSVSGGECIELQAPQEWKINEDSWMIDEKDRFFSREYILENSGSAPGVLCLADLNCEIGEETRIVLQIDQDDVLELFENGLSYELELPPGEKVTFRFAGEGDAGNQEDGAVRVTGICSWSPGESEENIEEEI